MRTAFHPFLPNGLTGDPVLWVDVPDQGHSVLLDLGDLRAIPHRKLLRVERAVVTHTHMDHFVGFDSLFRLWLGRDRELCLTGPEGFLRNVSGRLSGYTWNLIESYPVRLRVEEVSPHEVRSSLLAAARRLVPETLPERVFDGTLHDGEVYRIEAAVLDHGTPVLGVALSEHEHLAVNKDRLARLGLVPGPWLAELKRIVRAGAERDAEVRAATAGGGERSVRCDDVASEILLREPGQRLAYLTDLRHTSVNLERAVSLARGAHLLVCEAAFAHGDADLARERNHLTARQAGEIARAAGAKKLAPFHLSPRYAGREDELLEEAQLAFGGPVVRLPPGPEHAESE